MRSKFKGNCLGQDDVYFTHGNVVNLLVYGLDTWSRGENTDSTLVDCLFGAVNLYRNPHPDKYCYIGYGIRFDPCS